MAAFFQVMAFSNLHFSRTFHLVIFLAGWWIVLACVCLAFRIIRPPVWRQLSFLGIALPLQLLFYWLWGLPLAKGLFH